MPLTLLITFQIDNDRIIVDYAKSINTLYDKDHIGVEGLEDNDDKDDKGGNQNLVDYYAEKAKKHKEANEDQYRR